MATDVQFTSYSVTEFTEEEYLDLFAKFIVKHHAGGVEQILNFPDTNLHYSLIIE